MGYGLASAILAPVLLLQGRRVRRVATPLPEAPGPRDGIRGEGPPLRLLIVGDSAAAGVGASSQDEALSGRMVAELAPDFLVTWALIARAGATTAGSARHLAGRSGGDFDVAVLSLGANDILTGRPIARWLGDLDEVTRLLRARFGVRRFVVSGLPPMHRFTAFPQPLRWHLGTTARRYDLALARWAAERRDCQHVPLTLDDGAKLLAPDGWHPGPALFELWARELTGQVRRSLPGSAGGG